MAQAIFIRVETYARQPSKLARHRKSSVTEVCGEVARELGRCDHVDDVAEWPHKGFEGPRPPVVIAGRPPSEVPQRIDQDVAVLRSGGERAPRKDAHVMAGFVVSAPVTPRRYLRDRDLARRVDRFFWQSLAFLDRYVREHGGEVASAVVHYDESYMHLHVLAAPVDVPGYKADALQPAKAAKRAAQAAGRETSAANEAAHRGMQAFLTEFHRQVGRRFGFKRRVHARPRRRVSRETILRERRHVSPQPSAAPSKGWDADGRSSSTGVPSTDGRPWRLSDFVKDGDRQLEALLNRPPRLAADEPRSQAPPNVP